MGGGPVYGPCDLRESMMLGPCIRNVLQALLCQCREVLSNMVSNIW
jgi:hypothetical protein